MENQRRYAKTTKGIDEIGRRQHNLTGKVRMMLILVDPSKTRGLSEELEPATA